MNQGRLAVAACNRAPARGRQSRPRRPHSRRRIDQDRLLRRVRGRGWDVGGKDEGRVHGRRRVRCRRRVQRELHLPGRRLPQPDRHQRLHARAAHLHRTATGGVARAALLLQLCLRAVHRRCGQPQEGRQEAGRGEDQDDRDLGERKAEDGQGSAHAALPAQPRPDQLPCSPAGVPSEPVGWSRRDRLRCCFPRGGSRRRLDRCRS